MFIEFISTGSTGWFCDGKHWVANAGPADRRDGTSAARRGAFAWCAPANASGTSSASAAPSAASATAPAPQRESLPVIFLSPFVVVHDPVGRGWSPRNAFATE